MKLILKDFYKKRKIHRLDSQDYYRMGLISFYCGNYLKALNYFRSAVKIFDTLSSRMLGDVGLNIQSNLKKWLAFTGLVILFCKGKKIDFSEVNKIKLNAQPQKENSFLFSCCNTRKVNCKIVDRKFSKGDIYSTGKNDTNLSESSNTWNSLGTDLINLVTEVEEALHKVKENNKNMLESW